MRYLKSLWLDEGGATAVEYALILAAIAAVVVTVFILMGNKLNNSMVNVAAKIP